MTKHWTGTKYLMISNWTMTKYWMDTKYLSNWLTQKHVMLIYWTMTKQWTDTKKTHVKYWTVFTHLDSKTCELLNNDKTLNWHKHISHQTMTKHWCWVTEHWTDTKNLRVTGLWQNTELTHVSYWTCSKNTLNSVQIF